MAEPVQEASVLSARDLSPAVRELRLSPREWAVHFTPGQWISLKLPIGLRPPLVRAYSMAEPESSSGELVLVFDRVPGGLGSNYLFSLKHGDTVSISGPHGNFRCPEVHDKELLFVARYTGIVPVRCIIAALTRDSDTPIGNPAMTLLYVAPRTDLVYDSEFRQLSQGNLPFRYVVVPIDPRHDNHPGTVETDALRRLIGERRDFYPMVAGTKSFVRPLRTLLTEMGFERREMRQETYD